MITDADIKKMEKVFATKKELEASNVEIIKYIGEVKVELSSRIDSLENKFDTLEHKFDSLVNSMVNFKDQIIHEIKKIGEDNIVIIGYRDRIEDHENRIGKIETKIHI